MFNSVNSIDFYVDKESKLNSLPNFYKIGVIILPTFSQCQRIK